MEIDTHGLLSITPDDLIGQSVAILGIKGSGKSNTAAVLMEELLQAGIPVCVIDIAGEYFTLKDAFSQVAIIGNSLTCTVDIPVNSSNVCDVARKAYEKGISTVFDLSKEPSENREQLLASYFMTVYQEAAVLRIPLVIFLEEAHNWIPQRGRTAVSKVMTDIAAEGRKRGLSLVMVGQRSARINKDMLSQADIAFLHRVRHPVDVAVYIDIIPRSKKQVEEMVNKLKTGQALVLVGESVIRADIRCRNTTHIGATPTRANIPTVSQLSLLDLMGQLRGGSQ